MKGTAFIAILLALLSCGKGELDPATLTNNPFDPAYEGPEVFAFDTTYAELITFPSGQFLYQVIAFDVRSDLFLSPASYSVKVLDQESGATTVLDPNPAGSDHFTYFKIDAVIGTPVCLELRLFNNQSAASAERICATLQ